MILQFLFCSLETFDKVVEGWLACAERLTDTSSLKADLQRTNEPDTSSAFDVEKYSNYLCNLILKPLSNICTSFFIVS